jgi:hypothetical protein
MAKKRPNPASLMELINSSPPPDPSLTAKDPDLWAPLEEPAPPQTTLIDPTAPAPDPMDLLGESLDDYFSQDYVDAHTQNRIAALTHELAKRRVEALNLYEPLEVQGEFHASRAPYRLAIGSNRSGKTLMAAVEFARAVTGQDPHNKFPKGGGTAFVVGKDQGHLGRVIYAKLFRAGAFKIIRDQQTGRWRALRPWDAADVVREAAGEAKPAPPLIPKRFVENIAWALKGENVPAVITLTNGWEINFFSSLGKPPQGSPIDLFWFDEEIVDPNWYPEMAARLPDRRGRGMWSATPQAGTDQLYELHERAEKERATRPAGQRRIEEFRVLLADNRYMSEQAKREFREDVSDEEANVRIEGNYAILSYKVYPTFNVGIHGHEPIDVPHDWTLYAYIDPGHRTCAALFAAVPPTQDMLLVYDELYIHECNADLFAQSMKHAIGPRTIQSFVIDSKMGLHTELGVGRTVMEQYSEALARHGVKSVSTGSSFLFANSDRMAGVLAVQGLLRLQENGKPRLRIIGAKCPNFLHEIKRYHRKRVGGSISPEPDDRKNNHLMDCLRYLALHNPRWVEGRGAKQPKGSLASFRLKMKRRRERDGDPHINLGPGGKFY